MGDTAQFTFNHDGIGHLLGDRNLAVPVYQRSFSWEREEISDYWTDLKVAYDADQSEYFLGTIVLSEEGSNGGYTIIDGQQRLATTTILLAAIRDEFQKQGKQRQADNVRDSYISSFNARDEVDEPRLRLNSDDNPYFRKVIFDRTQLDEIKTIQRSHELIKDAYVYFSEQVESETKSAGEQWVEHLIDWSKFLENKVRIVVVDVPTDSDAFLIFETLNDRGADLTIADLLKNYLFGRAGDDLDTVRSAWMSALGALEMSADSKIFVTFVRHLWSSKHGSTRERLLYKNIKTRVTNREHVVDFAQELREAARSYAALLNSDHDLWSDLGTGARSNVETLLRLGLEQTRPLLLALMQHFTQAEFKVSLRALVSWGVRGLVVGGIGGGKTETAYCEAAVAIRKGQIKTADELLDQITEVVPNDELFKDDFERVRVTTSKLARYYLHALERASQGEREPELIPNEDEEKVNLEHILPRSPSSSEWESFNDDERKLYFDRLGNMVLLKKTSNERLGNRPWKQKRPVLRDSRLNLTTEVAENETWDATAVVERQKQLAELAVATWPRDPR